MNKFLTCNQVAALINFYVEGKLTPKLIEYVNLHIQNCPHCRKKIEDLKNILSKYNKLNTPPTPTPATVKTEFKRNLSAYIDNELNSNENIKIKKMTISNPDARKELENIYKFQKLLQGAYSKTKNDYKTDNSKFVMEQIIDKSDYTTTYFRKIALVFCALIILIVAGFIYLYF